MLSEEQVLAYRRDGYVLVRGLIPEGVRTDALVAIDQLLCAKWPAFSPSGRKCVAVDLHAKIRDLAGADRPLLGRIYDGIRKVAPFWCIAGGNELVEAARQLLASDTVGLAFRGCGIVLDLPLEDRWRSPWHQEYHSQMSSLRGLTAWLGLVPVTTAMGPVELLPGSHHAGLLAVRCPDAMNANRNYAETFAIPDVDGLVSSYGVSSYETDPGDVLFLDFLTVHQSGYNRDAERSRISGQVRYFNMLERSAVEHEWVGGWQDGGDFRRVHRDKVVP